MIEIFDSLFPLPIDSFPSLELTDASELTNLTDGTEIQPLVEANVLEAGGSLDLAQHHLPIADSHHAIEASAATPDDGVSFGETTEAGLQGVERVAGWQAENPHCGIHSVGNMVQIQFAPMGEEINRTIFDIAARNGWLCQAPDGGFGLNVDAYQPLLRDYFNVPCDWYFVQPEDLLPSLGEGHMAVAMGDAHYLDPQKYPASSPHAFNLTGYKIEDGEIFIKGLDSNVSEKEMCWPIKNVRKAMNAAANYGYGHNALLSRYAVGPVC